MGIVKTPFPFWNNEVMKDIYSVIRAMIQAMDPAHYL